MKKLFLLLVITLLFFTRSYSQKVEALAVGFYNLENLFDTINDPKNPGDDEFTPEGKKHWTSKRYWHKIHNLAYAISKIGVDKKMGIKGLSVIGVSEVEHKNCLVDLVHDSILKPLNFHIVHYESPDHRGIDVALLYNPDVFKVENSKAVPLFVNGKLFHTRSQLVVRGKLLGEDFAFIVNHWPSRYGGEKRSLPYRMAAAKLAYHLTDSLKKLNPEIKIVLMGDLNDDPISKSVKKYLHSKGKKNEVKNDDLYNPFEKLFKEGIGSLAYHDNWNLFDNMFVTPNMIMKNKNDLNSWKLYTAKVFNKEFLKQKDGKFAGYPYRTFVGDNFMGGYSDHFPVYMILIRAVK